MIEMIDNKRNIGYKELLFYSFIVLTVIMASFFHFFAIVLCLTMILYNLVKIGKTKSRIILVLELFILLYTIEPLFYFLFGMKICLYQDLDPFEYDSLLKTIQIQSIFLVVFLERMPIQSKICLKDVLPKMKSNVAWIFSLFCMLACFALIDWRQIITTFLSKGYTLERTGNILVDYFLLFALCNYIYCNTRNKRKVNSILIGFMALASLTTGARLSCIILLLLLYILHFEDKFRKSFVLIIFFVGFIGFNLLQYFRTSSDFHFVHLIIGKYDAKTNIIRNNPGDIWYASEAILTLITNGTFDYVFRLKSFLGTFMNSFLPTSLTPPEAILNQYIVDNRLIAYPNNGGLIGITTYVWAGYIGTVLSACLLSKLIRTGFENKNHSSIISVVVLSTLPKWYTYNPRVLFKFAFVGGVVFWIIKMCSKMGYLNGKVDNG